MNSLKSDQKHLNRVIVLDIIAKSQNEAENNRKQAIKKLQELKQKQTNKK